MRITGPRAVGAPSLRGSGTARLRHGDRVLPAFGDARQTAVVQLSVRTLFRSAPHRVILAF